MSLNLCFMFVCLFVCFQSAELQKDILDMQQKVKRYKEHIYELKSELEQRAEAITLHEQKVTHFYLRDYWRNKLKQN